jgi:HEPN domain-containing protein
MNGVSLLEETGRHNQWFALARNEIRNALILSKYDAEARVICTHYHEAVEKCLIGYLVYVTGELPERRNLIHLCRLAMQYDKSFIDVVDDVAVINSYYSEEKESAPGYEPRVLTSEDTERCFKAMKEVVAKVQLLLINNEKQEEPVVGIN